MLKNLNYMEHTKTIILDMDGTIAGTYYVKEWLEKIRFGLTSPYMEAKPLVDSIQLRNWLNKTGYKVFVVTMGPPDSNPEFDLEVAHIKFNWLTIHYPYLADRLIVMENHPHKNFKGDEKIIFATCEDRPVIDGSLNNIIIDDNIKFLRNFKGIPYPADYMTSIMFSQGNEGYNVRNIASGYHHRIEQKKKEINSINETILEYKEKIKVINQNSKIPNKPDKYGMYEILKLHEKIGGCRELIKQAQNDYNNYRALYTKLNKIINKIYNNKKDSQ